MIDENRATGGTMPCSTFNKVKRKFHSSRAVSKSVPTKARNDAVLRFMRGSMNHGRAVCKKVYKKDRKKDRK